MRVLIAGAGYVGIPLGRALCARGHVVFGLRRGAAEVPAPLCALSADLARPSTLAALPSGLTHVVFCAGADETSDAAYRRTYVEGLGNLLGALAGQRELARLVFTSSTAVYAQAAGEWVDELSPTTPAYFTGQRLLEAEELASNSGIEHVILRLAGIYGPGRDSLVRSVRDGRATIAAERGQLTNRIHRDDCAGAIAHLLELPQPEPLYVGVDDEPVERAVVLRWLAARLEVAEPRVSSPAEPPGRPTSNKRCCNTRLRESGYEFLFPTYREGYASLLSPRGGST